MMSPGIMAAVIGTGVDENTGVEIKVRQTHWLNTVLGWKLALARRVRANSPWIESIWL